MAGKKRQYARALAQKRCLEAIERAVLINKNEAERPFVFQIQELVVFGPLVNTDAPTVCGADILVTTARHRKYRNRDEAFHNDTEKFIEKYMSRNRKRGWDDVSFTVPAMAKQVPLWPGSPDMVKVSKDLWQFGDEGITRRLSYKEAAAIQTFPRDMVFCGNLTSKYKQIGNAVPCELARVVGEELYRILSEIERQG